ncbi:MAG TPA: hypothetical protein VEW04_11090 [Allosphingosinicella sp.]|nr:hypothetical protein [Allosphingosinicella sp.]
MGGILGSNLIATAAVLAPSPETWTLGVFAQNGVLLGMMAVAAFGRPRWLTGSMLVGMLAFYAWFAWVTLGR